MGGPAAVDARDGGLEAGGSAHRRWPAGTVAGMRVVAGSAKGRRLRAPAGSDTRPTSDRVRESVFNILTSMDALDGAAVADLFAGTGALGVEALSRGAASAVLVDAGRPALDVIRANLQVLEEPERATVVGGDVLRWLAALPPVAEGGPRWDVVFADPPYAWERWPELLARLAGRADLLVAESGGELDVGPGWEITRSRRYGTTLVTVARPAPPAARSRPTPSRPTPWQAEDQDLRTAPVPGATHGWGDG